VWGRTSKEARSLAKFRRLLGGMSETNRRLLFYMAQKMSRRWLLRFVCCLSSIPRNKIALLSTWAKKRAAQGVLSSPLP